MYIFYIHSNIKSKYQCSHSIVVRLTDLLSKKERSVNLMAIWIDYGMLRFCINSNIKSKYQCSHRIEVRLTNLLSKKQRSDILTMLIDYGMFRFCLKYGYNHRVCLPFPLFWKVNRDILNMQLLIWS